MRRVAITQRVVVDPAHGERRDALDQRWIDFLAACGLLPVPMPNRPETALALAAANEVSGLLLTGGNDLADYGGDAPERDSTEAALIGWARDRHLPVLGICRGMQVLLHEFGAPLERCSGHVATFHDLSVDGRTRRVNSFHRMAIHRLPAGFLARATDSDGVIEAAVHERERLAAMMWHPERMDPFDPDDIAYVRNFIEDTPCAA